MKLQPLIPVDKAAELRRRRVDQFQFWVMSVIMLLFLASIGIWY